MKYKKLVYILFLALVLTACDSLTGNGLQKIDITIKDVALRVEVASNMKTRNRGLMFRNSLPDNQGMIFVWPKMEFRNFWMKNTFIPLDIAYFDDQFFLINIQSMKPDDGSGNYGEYKSVEPAKYAVEVNAGWFKKHDIKKFNKLKLPHALIAIE